MKRSVALALTAVILAAIAVCFLRPNSGGTVGAVSCDGGHISITARPVRGEIDVTDIRNIESEPIPLETEGESELIRLSFERFDVINGQPSFVLSAESASKDRQFAYNVYIRDENGERSLPLGYVRRLGVGDDEEAELKHGSSAGFHSAIGSAWGRIIKYDEPTEFWQHITLEESGRYRITLFFYDWDGESGAPLSENPHEVSFSYEHRIPNAAPSIYCASFDNREPDRQEFDVTLLIARMGIDARRISAEIEKEENGRWVDCGESIADVSGNWRWMGAGKVTVRLKNLDPKTDYRLTIRLSGKDDEEEYALRLRFDG